MSEWHLVPRHLDTQHLHSQLTKSHERTRAGPGHPTEGCCPPPQPNVPLRSMEGQPQGSCIQPPGPAPMLGSKGHREPRSPASFQSTQNKADSGKGHGRNDRKNERKPHRSCELKASSCPVTVPHSSLHSQIHRLRETLSFSTCQKHEHMHIKKDI